MSLTSLLDDRSSVLGRWFRATFPNVGFVQDSYAAHDPGVQPAPASAANPGTLGAAFDWLIRLILTPQPDATVLVAASVDGQSRSGRLAWELLLAAPHVKDGEMAARWAWTAALVTEVVRVGLMPGSPLTRLSPAPTLDDAYLLTPDLVIEELLTFARAAQSTVLPLIRQRGEPLRPGATLAGSADVGGADLDVVANGLLVELKTTLGPKRRDGSRRFALSQVEIYQLLGYLLLDYTDSFRIDSCCIYNARWRTQVVWPVQQLLELLGVDRPLADLRADLSLALGGANPASARERLSAPLRAPDDPLARIGL
jgi:hypothetical protein